ncbi:HAMP domain-containing histidine kinase [Fibrella sp. HMF5335]|uniref:histidine kinase n=1 Tax=Fibrella rubiginis TaxID=2817060 RepID=A0A939GHN0_9BACT|nr:HAMP domain-containing sensor histidine kinase [Fibrella rubiginis]MBO0937963.1 HAMP domain-containing histidine kinase [Fibrella rubiginis]
MSTNRIRWIVCLMAVGLLGLVGFQLYWISNALHLQKEQFDYKVTDALQEVVRTLERQEIQYQARQRLNAQEQHQQLIAIGKDTPKATQSVAAQSPVVFRKPERRTAPAVPRRPKQRPAPPYMASEGVPGTVTIQMDALQPIQRQLTPEQLRTVEAFYRQQDELVAAGDIEAQLIQQERFSRWIDQVLQSHVNDYLRSSSGLVVPDSVARLTSPGAVKADNGRLLARVKRNRKITGKPTLTSTMTMPAPPNGAANKPANGTSVADQSEAIKAIFRGMMFSDRPLEERVDRFTLDTLLRQALQERGIAIPFDYAVRSKDRPQLLFVSNGASGGLGDASEADKRFQTAGYKAALFPNNLLETNNYVYLFFPNQQAFILERLTATLAGSAILILVIMACFYIAISTILRQKKMADIKNDFINNMTHEFKTPISTISLAVDMAREQLNQPAPMALAGGGPVNENPPVADRLNRYIGIIRDENQRLGSHVEKVLQMAMLDRGAIQLSLSSVNVHDVIEKVINSVGLQIEQRQGELDLEFDATNELVEADEVHLTNMLYNLVDNAIKYSPDQLSLRIRTRNTTLPSGQEAVGIAVADKGLGLTKEQQGRIFETFYRVPTGNRHDVKGFGLGLSYVKKMAEEHHGLITVSSTPGEGSEFEIVIPTFN